MSAAWPTVFWLAQTNARTTEEKLREAAPMLLLLFGILVGAVIVACIVIFIVRNRSLKSDAAKADIPLSLAEIRRMHRNGEIDDDEMQRLKTIVTGQVGGKVPPGHEAESRGPSTEAEETHTPAEEQSTPPAEEEA